jgi:hypothetical protein
MPGGEAAQAGVLAGADAVFDAGVGSVVVTSQNRHRSQEPTQIKADLAQARS